MPHTKEKKRVLLIGTGGTIASEVPWTASSF